MAAQIELPQITEQMQKRPTTAMELLSVALQNNAAIDVIERLAALQEKAQNREAETRFNEAMNAAQSEIGRVAPDANNPQTHSKYATYAKLDKVLRPIYLRHGFSLSFDSGDSPADTVVAYCYVSHRDGHTRRYQSPPMPADGKGAKGGDVMTKTHATGAAMSYAMRYLLKYIFNIAIGEDDTDGNTQGGELQNVDEWLESVKDSASLEELQARYTEAYKAASAAKDLKAKDAIVYAKNIRKEELRKAGAK